MSYPAVSVGYGGFNHYLSRYKQSVVTGETHLLKQVRGWLQGTCGQTLLFLVGYSQGAHVVGDVYQRDLSSYQRSRIGGVALIGDPRFKGGQGKPVDVGTYSSKLNGIWDTVGSPRTIDGTTKVRSYCAKGDPICNFSVPNAAGCKLHPSSCVHSHYFTLQYGGHSYTADAALWLVRRWQRATRPVVTAGPSDAPGACVEPYLWVDATFPDNGNWHQAELVVNGVSHGVSDAGSGITWQVPAAFGQNQVQVKVDGRVVATRNVSSPCSPDVTVPQGISVTTQVDSAACTLTLAIDGSAYTGPAFFLYSEMNGNAVAANGQAFNPASPDVYSDGVSHYTFALPKWPTVQYYAIWNTGDAAGQLASTDVITNPCG